MELEQLLKSTSKEIAEYLINNKKLNPSLPARDDNPWYKELTPVQIYRITLECAKALKLNLEQEPLYYILNDSKNIGVAAGAGSGKTTTTTFRLFRQICLSGYNPKKICVMTFTKEAEKNIVSKFEYIRNTCNPILKRYGIYLDKTQAPIIKTLNSLTYNIILDFPKVFGYKPKNYIVSDTVAFFKMEEVLKVYADQFNLNTNKNSANILISYYNIQIESQLFYEDMCKQWEIQNMKFNPSTLETVFKAYKVKLDILGVCHHSESCAMILEKCKEDLNFKNTLENIYDYIVIDEAQDITENVKQLLKILINDKNKSCIIGDDDQRIYAFRGSLKKRLVDLFAEFNSSEICTLSLNRRCKKEILEFSKIILDNIESRFPMKIRSNKEGGEVEVCLYENNEVVYNSICERFNNINPKDLKSICVSYRNNITGFILSNLFLEKGIPYIIKDNYKPGNDFMSKALQGIFNMLNLPSNSKIISENLFKVTSLTKKPISLEKVKEVISEDKLLRYYNKKNLTTRDLNNEVLIELYVEEIMKLENQTYFYDTDFLKYFSLKSGLSPEDLEEDLRILKKLSKDLRGDNIYFEALSLKEILPSLLKLFNKYYWLFMKKTKDFPEVLEDIIINDMTSREETYMEWLMRRENQMNEICKLSSKGIGVTLSTFHSMKGLEYDEVILIDLEKDVFPSIRITEGMSDEEKITLIEDELFLFYVASTRPKNKLIMWWSETNKSLFYPLIEEYQEKIALSKKGSVKSSNTNLKNLDLIAVDLTKLRINENVLDLDFNNKNLDLNLDESEIYKNKEEIDLTSLDLNLTENLNLTLPEFENLNSPQQDNLSLTVDLNLTKDLNLTEDLNLSDKSLTKDLNLTEDLNISDKSLTKDLNLSDKSLTKDLNLSDKSLNEDLILENNKFSNTKPLINLTELKVDNTIKMESQVYDTNEEINKQQKEDIDNTSGFINVAGGEQLKSIIGILFTVPED